MACDVLFLAVVASAVTAAPSPPAGPQPVVALAPPTAEPALAPLALLIAARASEMVEATGGTVEVHLKQVAYAIADLGPGASPEAIRAEVGADRLVLLAVEGTPARLRLTVASGTKAPAVSTVVLPADWPAALDVGGVAVARALLGRAPLRTAVQPRSSSAAALAALGACYGTALKQPLTVETPSLLEPAELEAAATACRTAAEKDPTLSFATAAGALIAAITGADEQATAMLARLGAPEEVLEPYTLARFWLLTRYQSNEAGAAFLSDIVKRHPGELMARSYLGETLLATGELKWAEAVWREYLALVPRSPWALGRLSKALARQGKHVEAVATARKAVELAPSSAAARLELGSRLIDAGQAAAAVTELTPLLERPSPHGEHVLRLGWARWLEGDVDGAAALFEKALALAVSPGEWRTRGRALYDMALVEAKRGRPDAARAALRASAETGFRVREPDPLVKELVRELERAAAGPADAGRVRLVPREISLFPLDAFGEPDPSAKKPPPPEGLVLYRF